MHYEYGNVNNGHCTNTSPSTTFCSTKDTRISSCYLPDIFRGNNGSLAGTQRTVGREQPPDQWLPTRGRLLAPCAGSLWSEGAIEAVLTLVIGLCVRYNTRPLTLSLLAFFSSFLFSLQVYVNTYSEEYVQQR